MGRIQCIYLHTQIEAGSSCFHRATTCLYEEFASFIRVLLETLKAFNEAVLE